MANSKLLKEAIADAKAVRETAIANAKIALEEAFTPRLQSILSKKLQAEMEGEEEEAMEEELDSSDIGNGDNVDPSAEASDAHIDLGAESEEETAEVGEEDEALDVVSEEESEEETMEEGEGSIEDPTNADDAEISEEEMEDEDELDLESIIRELEMGMEDEEEVSEEEDMDSEEEMYEEEDEVSDEEDDAIDAALDSHEDEMHSEEDSDDEIDLDEILREMGYGDDEEEVSEEEYEDDSKVAELEAELEEAYATVKSLQSTINEVNLLNAKLLYANRLFRAYNLTNEQKGKVVENLDRTSSVREVKLVYATLAESMNFTGTERKTKKVVAEAASKPVASTAPKKEIISESTNALAERFKQLANIK
jgi:hypothetical protein